MARLVRFPLQGGGDVVVELDDAIGGPVLAGKQGEIVAASESFEKAAAGIRPIAQTVLANLKDLGPEAITVEFSVKFTAQAGVVLAKASTEGACKITLTWKP